MNFFDFSFWQNFMSNALATIIGAAIGIPIALWLSRYQETIVEKERKNKILGVLKRELLENYTILSGWQKADRHKKNLDIHSIGPVLKDESWAAFSDGGELEWLKDPILLSNLSDAYYHIRLIRQISDRYLNIIYLSKESDFEHTLDYYGNLLDRVIIGGATAIRSVLDDISS